MHKTLNKLALAGMTAAFVMTPALASSVDDMAAKTTSAAPEGAVNMTPEQKAAMKSWPAEKQAAFKAWPAETQAYYWSLAKERQAKFWSLTDREKVALSKMSEAQRESTWARIDAETAPSRS